MQKIQIGVLLPLTGENKEIGNAILNALELALFQADSKNINLIIEDTKADPETTKKILNKLTKKNIKFFVGPLYSESLASVESYAPQQKVKFFALTNNSNLAKNDVWVFGIDPQQQTSAIIDFLIVQDKKKIGLLLPENAYGYLLYNTIEKVLDKSNVKPLRVEFFKDNISSQQLSAKKIAKGFAKYENYLKDLEEVNNSDIKDDNENILTEIEKPLDSIFIAASGQTLTILASQLQYSNVDPKKVTYAGISSWEDESILQEPALNSSIFSTTTDYFQKEVVKTYSIAFGREMPKVAMVAYDILSLISSTIKENGVVRTTDLLNESGYLGLRGLFRLKANGIVERTFQIKKIENSQFKIIKKAPEFFSN